MTVHLRSKNFWVLFLLHLGIPHIKTKTENCRLLMLETLMFESYFERLASGQVMLPAAAGAGAGGIVSGSGDKSERGSESR